MLQYVSFNTGIIIIMNNYILTECNVEPPHYNWYYGDAYYTAVASPDDYNVVLFISWSGPLQ